MIRKTIPGDVKGVSTGHITHDKGIERVPWKGGRITADLVAMRAFNLALAGIPLALAVLIFDRFDPARGRRRARKQGRLARLVEKLKGGRFAEVADADGFPVRAVALSPVAPHPTAKGAIYAEARLIWESATWIKWPLAIAALLAGLLPGNFAQGLFLVLLVPVISEVAAREKLAGTRALVYSQPGVPSSPALWKTAAVSIVVLMLGAPLAMQVLPRLADPRARVPGGPARGRRHLGRARVAVVRGQALLGAVPRGLVHGAVEPPGRGLHVGAFDESGADVLLPLYGARRGAGGGGGGAGEVRAGLYGGRRPSPLTLSPARARGKSD